ncbi:MAG: hypothetical protein HYX22_00745 [Candidatus Yanofskybacteria bacterium]|nr:hypothetical protein [Candidatus Yanofskybacteria bacterium]
MSRLFWGKRTAIFEVTLEAQIGEIERYTPDTEDGWLVVQDDQGVRLSLPAYILVRLTSLENSREYFIPSEGTHRGELLSAPLKDDDSSYLISDIKHEPAISAEYSISEKILCLTERNIK